MFIIGKYELNNIDIIIDRCYMHFLNSFSHANCIVQIWNRRLSTEIQCFKTVSFSFHLITHTLRWRPKNQNVKRQQILLQIKSSSEELVFFISVHTHHTNTNGGGCRIHQLHLFRRVRPHPVGVLDRTLNNLMVRL